VFYSLPQYAHFYSEMLNLITETDASCTVLFSKYDKLQLERIVGAARCDRMINNPKTTFLFC
jgi:U3 small nucleolar RNA-associated protein 25